MEWNGTLRVFTVQFLREIGAIQFKIIFFLDSVFLTIYVRQATNIVYKINMILSIVSTAIVSILKSLNILTI